MKKGVYGKKLSRTKNQRAALFKGLCRSLIQEGFLTTTLPKAKAVIGEAEKLITKAKNNTPQGRNTILKFLGDKTIVNKLVDEIAPLFKDKKGGYLRITRVGFRKGDNCEMGKLTFTEKLVIKDEKLEDKKEKTSKKETGKKKEKINNKKENDKINK